MAESKTAVPSKIKIQRTRKRLYEATESETPADLAEKQAHYANSRRMVDYHAAFASTAGFIPIPVIDIVMVSAVQIKLIRSLSKVYGVAFSRQRSKAIIAGLLGGLQTGLISSSASKYIPAIGPLATIPTALSAGALTYAIGRVFIYHFELGGTLLDFNADKLREYFRRQLNQKPQKTIKASDGSDKV